MAAALNLAEGTAPSTPGANTHNLYVDVSGNLHTLSDAAADKTLATSLVEFATANFADEAITNVKLAHMAEATFKGRAAAAGTGDATDLTVAEFVTLLGDSFAETESDAAWTNFTLAAGWGTTPTLYPTGHTYPVPGYRKMGGVVYLRGMARYGAGSVSVIGTLPTGYRPTNDAMYVGYRATSLTPTRVLVWVYADGQVVPYGSGNASYHIDGICFVPA